MPTIAEFFCRRFGESQGRHKACPYRTFMEAGEGRLHRRARAGTRPAPTGLLSVEGEGDARGWAWLGARSAHMGI